MADSTTEQTYYVPKPASTMERSVMFIETPANAERIIRACSLLPELITALEEASMLINKFCGGWEWTERDALAAEIIDATRAKARGES